MLGLLIWLSGKQPNRGGYWSLKLFHFRLDFDFDTLSGFAVGHDVEVAINRFAIRSRSQTHGEIWSFRDCSPNSQRTQLSLHLTSITLKGSSPRRINFFCITVLGAMEPSSIGLGLAEIGSTTLPEN